MPWFKVDDGFNNHRKVRSIPRAQRAAAIGLWTLAGSWSAENLTDGFVPEYMLTELGCTRGQAAALVQAELWRRVDGGYAFHEWEGHQPSREQVTERRAKTAERVARWRAGRASESQRHTAASNGVTGSVTNDVSNAAPDPTRPDPTRKEQHPSSPDGEGEVAADHLLLVASDGRPIRKPMFDDFWDAYPRKAGKIAAQKAWDVAVKSRKVDPRVIVEGAQRYRDDPNLPEEAKRPYPQKWLNGGHWGDPPCPPRFEASGRQEPAPLRPDGSVNADAVLGKDNWQPDSPPSHIEPGTRAYVQWLKDAWAVHNAERADKAREVLARRSA